MAYSWTLDGLKDRLKEHGEFIDSVISLIPPKYYFKNNPSISEKEDNFQPNKKKRLPKQVINEQKKQAKRRKLDPNNLKTVKDIQKEILVKIKQEKEKEKEQNEKEDNKGVKDNNNDKEEDNEEDSDEKQVEAENDVNEEEEEENEKSNNAKDEFDENDKVENKTKIVPPFKSMKKEPRKQLTISDSLANFSKKNERKNLNETKKQERKLKRKLSKINKDGEKNAKKGGDIKEDDDIKKDGDTIKNGNVKKNGGIKRKISEEEDSQQKNGDLQFANFDFVDEKKKKKKINDVHLMNKLQKKVEKKEELKKKDPEKAIELHEKETWSKIFKKAQGEKVIDDPRLLKKTIKKKVISKKKSEKAWKDRIKSVEKSMAERQQKRTENIQARIASKKNKKNKRK